MERVFTIKGVSYLLQVFGNGEACVYFSNETCSGYLGDELGLGTVYFKSAEVAAVSLLGFLVDGKDEEWAERRIKKRLAD